ncbi:amino acid adenylation domain-containing protein [Kitasatospora sp. NPDC048540]|uniref:non-ribosomal peptide synthetase n=1 Tax=Kitasatospora sp. NPDC048540 TaxID=3155634 RepID=UPI0033F3DE4A
MTEQTTAAPREAGPAGRREPAVAEPAFRPLTAAQRYWWWLDRNHPELPIHTSPVFMRLRGALELPVLRSALAALFAEHPSLGAVFTTREGVAGQAPVPGWSPPLSLVDAAGEPAVVLAELAARERRRRFDPAVAPAARAVLVRFAPDHHVLMISTHRLRSDDRSRAALHASLVRHYAAGAGSAAPSAPAQPVTAQPSRGRLDEEYWHGLLAGAPALLDLPVDRPQRDNHDFRGERETVELTADQSAALRSLAADAGCTPFDVLLAALQVVLARHTRQQAFLVGTVHSPAGRPAVGRHDTLLPLRADLRGRPTVTELLGRVRESRAEAAAHPGFPYDRLADALDFARSPGRMPLLQVVCSPQPAGPQPADAAGLRIELLDGGEDLAPFELACQVAETAAGVRLTLTYQSKVFDRATVVRLAGHWLTVLTAMAAGPGTPVDELPLLAGAERQQALAGFNRTRIDLPDTEDVARAVARHAAERGGEPAVECAGRTLTYRELDRRVNALAGRLLERGLRPDTRVGILLEPSPDFVVSVLAVLRAGCAAVPLDADSPAQRLALMIGDSAAALVLTQQSLLPRLAGLDCAALRLEDCGLDEAAGREVPAVEVPVHPDGLAYVIFTSGSTGRPNGVAVSHGSLRNYLAWVRGVLIPDPDPATPVISRLTFDGALKQLFTPLLNGRTAWLLPTEVVRDPAELTRQLAGRGTDVVVGCTPSLCEAILEFGDPAAHRALTGRLKRFLLGGERVDRELVNRIRRVFPDTEVWNVYGPTETTANASTARVDRTTGATPIGGPVWNCTYYVLDERMEPVPVGVTGELHIGGTPVARGYTGRGDLTAERFVPDPFGERPGGRLYRTGDLVRRLPGGAVEFVGRRDHQVKIRGMRIEPGEVEAALREHPGVTEAVVVVRTDGLGTRLVAYLRARTDGPSERAVRGYLRERLPDYLVPAAIEVLDSLPHLSNGKIDRKSLPAPRSAVAADQLPRTATERTLASVWGEVLGITEQIGVHADFFELGGHSLLAARAAARLTAVLGVRVTVGTLFAAPTIARLAPLLAGPGDGRTATTPVDN